MKNILITLTLIISIISLQGIADGLFDKAVTRGSTKLKKISKLIECIYITLFFVFAYFVLSFAVLIMNYIVLVKKCFVLLFKEKQKKPKSCQNK